MRRTSKSRVPTYRLHRPSGQAVVTLRGKDYYLGKYGSSTSRAEYDRLIAEYQASKSTRHATQRAFTDLTIAELCAKYVDHAESYYRKHGRLTSEIHTIRKAIKTIRSRYAHVLATEFGPLSLKTCRQQWIEEGVTRRGVNRLTQTVRAIFRWSAENELVPVEKWQALTAVAGLKKGRTAAPEPEPVRPVAEDELAKTIEAAHPMIRAMILIQLKTGMRPGELLQLRVADIETTGEVWVFKPLSHKLEHQSRERVVFIGPEALVVLKPWLRDDPDMLLFGPRQLREYDLRDKPAPRVRSTREKQNRKRRVLRDRYTSNGQLQAIRRVCGRAKVARWSPNQLRLNAATVIRARYGVEAARTVLGHSDIGTTQIYAEADLQKAEKIMKKLG